MPRRPREDCTSDSELADSIEDPFDRETESDFDHPTQVSDSDNDEPSPSQYRNEMAMRAADESINDKSEREEDVECQIGEMLDGYAYDRMVNSKKSGSEQMFAQFLNVTCKFTETLEDLRKQELMVSRSKTACISLDYDKMQPPSCGRQQQFTPQRKGAQLISASPDDFEAEFMTSQSQTARTRLTENLMSLGSSPSRSIRLRPCAN